MQRAGFLVAFALSLWAAPALAEAPQAPAPPAGASDWSRKKFVHPPLKCMELYKRIDEYPVIAWCFHGRGSPGYDEEFVKQAQACGFNVLLDAAIMLKPVQKFPGMKVMPVVFRFPPERITAEVFNQFGDNERILGFVLDDNCPRIYGWSVTASNWLRKNYPHVVPYISENPDPRGQSRTAMRVLGTQNYWYTRSSGGWGQQAFCSTLGRDRDHGNATDMSFWPLISSPCSPAGIRFQALAAAAHGAQGVCYFAYCPGDRWPQWKHPQGDVAQAAAHANAYLTQVAGPHIWGTRCMAVLHSASDGNVPSNAGRAGHGQVIEKMDGEMLAGLLLPEVQFRAKLPEGQTKLPLYAFAVDKRFRGPARTCRIEFSPDVRLVEVFPHPTEAGPDKLRIIEPGWSVPLNLVAGDGRLMRLNGDDLEPALGPALKDYLTTVDAVAALRLKVRDGKATLDEFNRTMTQVRRNISLLSEAPSKLPAQSAAQRRDTLARLTAQIDYFRDRALQARIATEPGQFAGKIGVVLASSVEGSEIRYTTDGSEPTLASARYGGPIPVAAATKIRARSADPVVKALVGREISGDWTPVQQKGLGDVLRVHFQPANVPAPEGMIADTGQPLQAHDNGWVYGWDRDMTRQMQRLGDKDPVKDTFVHCEPGAKWTIPLESGTYEVTLCFRHSPGNAKTAPLCDSLLEGVLIAKDVKVAPNEFKVLTQAVEVKDGRLTYQSHGNGPPWQPRICYLEIRKK